jgi:hypothetical protein
MKRSALSILAAAALAGLAATSNVHAANGKGLTIGLQSHDSTLGIDFFNVNFAPAGDPYVGDTSCTAKRPVLCLKQDGSRRPPYHVDPGREFYNGWVEGHFMLTKPLKGTLLTSQAAGDAQCAQMFNPPDPSWKMAEWHVPMYVVGMDENNYYDAAPQSVSPWPTGAKPTGGHGYYGYSNLPAGARGWMAINTTAGNCWN